VLISSIAEGLDVAVQVIPARVTRCSYRPTAGPQANAGEAAIADIDGRRNSPAVVEGSRHLLGWGRRVM